MVRLSQVIALALASFALVSCGLTEPSSITSPNNAIEITSAQIPLTAAEKITITTAGTGVDLAGNPVQIADASRVIALAPGAAELIYALGVGDSLVGRDLTDNQAELQEIPVVTDTHSANLEKILSTNPTLVIADSNTRPIMVLDELVKAGVQVVKISVANNLTSAQSRVVEISEIFGGIPVATELINSFQITPNPAMNQKVAFLYLRGQSAIYLVGGKGSGADALIAATGATDVAAAANFAAFTPITPEAFIELNPDVLLVMTKGLESVGGIDGLVKIPGISQTTAAKLRQVVAVEDSLLLSYGGRTAALITELKLAFESFRADD